MATPGFPDYGDSGDMAGARRSRRAFRLCVASCVAITGMLWFTERFLRYEQTEYLYLKALTLPRSQARDMLQQAIKIDGEIQESPTPKYTEALAVREVSDVVLSVYAEASRLEPSNSLFAVRHGCKLLEMGYPEAAADRFREAAAHPPKNALPAYLEAASLATASLAAASRDAASQTAASQDATSQGAGSQDVEAFENAMIMAARTNSSNKDIVFPRPLWFSGLPQDGYQYADLSRKIVSESCAPLGLFARQVISAAAERRLGQIQMQSARTWLGQIRAMGEHLATRSEPMGTLQAIMGIAIELEAIGELAKFESAGSVAGDSKLMERQAILLRALEGLEEFEAGRDARVEAGKREVWFPLGLFGWGAVCVISAYLLGFTLHKSLGLRKTSWTVSHSALGKGVLCGGCLFLLFLAHVLTFFQHLPGSQSAYAAAISPIWWTVLGVLIFFGCVYPAVTLESAEVVSRKLVRPEEIDDALAMARRAYRRAYMSMAVRYYGILSGLFACVVCAWVISYRIVMGLYPWQVELLASGLLDEEIETARRALALLG